MKDRRGLVALDALGRRYGLRPSEIVGEDNPFAALTLDLAAHNEGIEEERRAQEKAAREVRRK